MARHQTNGELMWYLKQNPPDKLKNVMTIGVYDDHAFIHPATEAEGLFVAKINVSEIPIEELETSLPAFERQLLVHSYGIQSIDYTQDFS